jgi:hypothetical protein
LKKQTVAIVKGSVTRWFKKSPKWLQKEQHIESQKGEISTPGPNLKVQNIDIKLLLKPLNTYND